LPFGFIHEPPSVNRLIGLTWLLHKFFPDQAPGNLRDEVRAFYRQFYQVEPTDAEIGRVLDGN
jgi:iron complex transport system substrate-binding protein